VIIKDEVGKVIEIERKKDKKKVTWTIVEEVHQDLNKHLQERRDIGPNFFVLEKADPMTIFADLFLQLSPHSWQTELFKMNVAIQHYNANPRILRPIKEFIPHGYFIVMSLIIAATSFPEKGDALFHEQNRNYNKAFISIAYSPKISKYMKLFRFKEFQKFIPDTMVDEELNDSGDPCYKFSGYVTAFNKVSLCEINILLWDLADETMSAFRPRTTKLGGLPNISFIL